MAGTESRPTDMDSIGLVLTSIDSEILALKKIYNRCKVISNQGDFLHILIIQPFHKYDLRIIFQLSDQYPKQPPETIVQSQSLIDENLNALQEMLHLKATSYIGSYMIQSLINFIVDWLEKNINFNISSNNTSCEQETDKESLAVNIKSQIHLNKCKKSKIELQDEKKPSMKTADNVIKRLLWDETVPRELFSIGYLDRFEGVMEKPFSLFNWEDIASVDYTVLAIPKHRIQYFKYRDAKVWDKNERLDIIFGSTGSDITIQEFIHNYDLEFGDPIIENIIKINLNDDSSSEDETLDGILNNKYQANVPYDHTNRPNYFLSIRITNLNIITEILKIQSSIKEKEPRLSESCIPGPAMHLTLGVLKLDSLSDVADAVDILKKAPLKLAKYFSEPLILKFEGLDHFRNAVLYAKVEHNENFLKFVNELMSMLNKFSIKTFDYVPHMTIIKVSRPLARKMRSSFINPLWYQDFINIPFGDQEVTSMFLCSIRADKRDDGFYVTTTEVNFDTNEVV